MSQLIIGDPLPTAKVPKDCFKIYIKTMEGDADDWHYRSYTFKTAEEALEEYKAFKAIEGYDLDSDKGKKFLDSVGGDWPSTDYGIWDILESMAVTYFDKNGVEHSVIYEGKNLSEGLKYVIPK